MKFKILMTFISVLCRLVDSSAGTRRPNGAVDGISDFRAVKYEALLPNMNSFTEIGVGYFEQILFDVKRYQLIVGARDTLFRLSLDALTRLEMADWTATPTKVGLCTAKGQSDQNCRNFIKVLLEHNDKIFACGTHAFSPKCSWREAKQLRSVTEWVDGRARCPYSPEDNSTAIMTESGDYYIGSATDFSSNDHAIYRWSGDKVDKNALRTLQYNSHWVSQPDFVGSFEDEKFVYFVFREPAVEFMNCGKAVYSRIARVCKSDRGGNHILKDNWTTFLKARLNCSVPGNYPFYYNEIQSMSYVGEDETVYATFSTTENSIPGTAICSFNLSSIQNAFKGPFKYQERSDSTWGPVKESSDHFQCDQKPDSDGILIARKYQLMDTSVQSFTNGPLYKEDMNKFDHIAVDGVATKHQDSPAIHVIFVATANATIRKLSFNPRSGESCLVEVLQPFPTTNTHIRQMKLLEDTGSLYLATDEAVLKIPVQRCHRFRTKKDCLNAMDPYCGWNRNKDECTTAPNRNARVAYWQQNVISCPVTTDPVDGDWAEWSGWDQCAYSNPSRRVESGGDYCMCRRRSCDNPAPANGGAGCDGPALVVTNCTQHGQWTAWSEWSGCSQSCGVGLKTRQRHCGNPEPAFGGRVCVGRDREESYCDDLPPCPGQRASSLLLLDDGGDVGVGSTWSQWSDWTACSARCGSGFKSRGRKCYGVRCTGCDREWAECENSACSDYQDVTDWTPWINTTVESGGWYEKRFTFTYRTPVAINKAGRIGEERRYCYGPNRCTTIGGGAVGHAVTSPEDFTEWSACSRKCGGGRQFKLRTCSKDSAQCLGNSLLEQECNTQPCPGSWACWSSWTRCTSTGTRSRTRVCQSVDGGGDDADCTVGDSREEEACTHDTPQLRNMDDAEIIPVTNTVSINMVIGACVVGFLVGSSLAALLVYYFFKYRKSTVANGNGVVGGGVHSPHYISAKSQNLYVSLPMLDLKHKQLGGGGSSTASDYSGTLRSNATGTLRSKNGSSVYGANSKPGEYETATIKRSHSRRDSSLITGNGAAIRADLDSEQLFS